MELTLAQATAQLKSKQAALRAQAALALGMLGDPAAIPALLVAIHERNEVVRNNASLALGMLGAPALPHLLKLLRGRDERARVLIPYVLAQMNDPSAVEPLLAALRDDPSPRVRAQSAMAIPHFVEGREQIVAALRHTCEHDPDEGVRYFAEHSLALLTDWREMLTYIESLIRELDDPEMRDIRIAFLRRMPAEHVRRALAEYAGELREESRWRIDTALAYLYGAGDAAPEAHLPDAGA